LWQHVETEIKLSIIFGGRFFLVYIFSCSFQGKGQGCDKKYQEERMRDEKNIEFSWQLFAEPGKMQLHAIANSSPFWLKSRSTNRTKAAKAATRMADSFPGAAPDCETYSQSTS